MGEQVRELFNWARRRKILAAVFVAFTLAVGILIGSVVSGRVSAMKSIGFSGTTATALAVPYPIPSSSSIAGLLRPILRWAAGRAATGGTKPGLRRDRGQAWVHPDEQPRGRTSDENPSAIERGY